VARHGHWPAYAKSRELSIAAIVDRRAEGRRLAASLDPALKVYETFEQLADAETLDFVDICTPPAIHEGPMMTAIDRGWHVVCEKPFLIDPAAIVRARDGAAARGLAVVPVHNWQFAPIVRDATERLRRGAIGRLRHVEIETERLREFSGGDPAGFGWRRDATLAGGGILMDHGWHAVYLALQWFGERPSAVRATLHRPHPQAVEDEADATLVFAAGEATIRLTWNGLVRRNRMRLEGDRGSILIDDDRLVVRTADGSPEETRFPSALSAGSHHADWFAAFIPRLAEYFRAPDTSRAAFDEAAACLDVIQRAYAL
jgi:predicted dehydrogenase